MRQNVLKVQVLQRAVDILEIIGADSGPVSLKRITELVGLPKSTVYRLLTNLEARGLVSCGNDGGYRLGLSFLLLGQRAEKGFEIKRLARPYMQKLNEIFSESVHLGVLHKNRVLYVDSIDSPHAIRLVARIGGTNMVHCTALGKVLLILHSDEEIRQILVAEGMEQRTPYSLLLPQAYLEEMEEVRRRGFALDDRESGEDCFCIGAPIYSPLGQVVAAISVSGPTSRMSRPLAQTHIAPKLLEVTKALSKALGCQ
ncbi:MAG: IclR family transcriptional regulator [Negativicutes bacterium]|nr:IclR family transcriptional regulator [Negativicutes bacterium]